MDFEQRQRLQPVDLNEEDEKNQEDYDEMNDDQNEEAMTLTRQLLENRKSREYIYDQNPTVDSQIGVEGATDPLNNYAGNSRGEEDPRQMNEIEYQQMLERIGL